VRITAQLIGGRSGGHVWAERTALPACKADANSLTRGRRAAAQATIWLSMALAREGKREEAARAIGPVVTMYRGLEKRNHGDQWLPLEFAEALYAQAFTDAPHRAALLHQASRLVNHLIPSIARLHDTRAWRARIEGAQRTVGAGRAPFAGASTFNAPRARRATTGTPG